jgi:hypothetical protein
MNTRRGADLLLPAHHPGGSRNVRGRLFVLVEMRYALLSLACAIAIAGVALGPCRYGVVQVANAGDTGPASRPGSSDVPIVVELFTSEGCSSCPPADDVLARLEQSQPVKGARVVPLAFHVDYWDDLGWPDPFASPSFTARQRTYARRGGGMYTPQAVVDGSTDLVGSRANALVEAIRTAALRPHASVGIEAQRKGGAVDLTVHVGPLPKAANAAGENRATVLVALTQSETKVDVPRGENAGKTLRHTAIVREIETAGTVDSVGGDLRTALHVPNGVSDSALRVVALVQRKNGNEIVGSATQPAVR